ncbi:MAG TPA: hypothetical protein VLC73_03160 [Burkholderiales bacterium]|nr:hypothetical protein [Burkholderiales bacterium]
MQTMLRCWSIVPVIALAALMSGCAGTISNMREVPPGSAITAPEPGKAVVVFTRTSGFGAAIQSSVFEVRNNRPALIGILAAKTKVAYKAEPGNYLFMVLGENADFLIADLQPDKTYYVDVVPRMGLWKARFSLEPKRRLDLDTPDFKSSLDECRWVEKTPASDNWALQNMASIQSKRADYYPDWQQKPPAEKPQLLAEDGR